MEEYYDLAELHATQFPKIFAKVGTIFYGHPQEFIGDSLLYVLMDQRLDGSKEERLNRRLQLSCSYVPIPTIISAHRLE